MTKMVITFSGASDDLVEVGIPGAKHGGEEYNVNPEGPQGYAGSWLVGADVKVRAFYGRNGVWGFTAEPAEEGALITYDMNITNSDLNAYSAQLNIEVPIGTRVVQLHA